MPVEREVPLSAEKKGKHTPEKTSHKPRLRSGLKGFNQFSNNAERTKREESNDRVS